MSRGGAVTVRLGNPNPQMTHEVVDRLGNKRHVQRPAPHLNQSVTSVVMRRGFDDPTEVNLALTTDNDPKLLEIAAMLGPQHQYYAIAIHELEQILSVHSGGVWPAWVEVEEERGGVFRRGRSDLAEAISAYFGCPIGEYLALLTNGGRDALHKQHMDTAAQPAAFNYGALSANTGAGFAASDTTLAGEIVTASGGLIRKQMTFAHTTGTNTSTLTATWTANGSDSVPVTIASWANFNAASVGTMGEEGALNATATITVSGDNLTVTFTLTAG